MGNYKIEFRWAFIFIGALIVWSFLEKILGFHDQRIEHHALFTMLFMIPAIWIYVVALKKKKRDFYPNEMTFRRGFVAGLIMTVVITACTPMTQWIITYVVSPGYFENMILYSVETRRDTLEGAQAYFNFQNYAIQNTIWSLIMGLFTSAIVAFFIRSKSK